MKIIIAALALLALAAAVPLEYKEPTKILREGHEQDPSGHYNFNFESEDGIARQEEGTLKEVLDEEKKPHKVVVVQGSYTYVNNEGKTDTITYEADEKGYRASGESIPKQVSRR